MRFDGITCNGKLIIQRVTALPNWQPTDEGRVIYDQVEKKMYLGTNAGWTEIGSGGYGAPVTNFIDNGTLEPGKLYFIDTAAGPLSGNLIATPRAGDTVTIVDSSGTFGTYSFTINGNGKTIHIDNSVEADIKDVVLILVYTGSKWKLDVGGLITNGGISYTAIFDTDFFATNGMVAFVDTRNQIVTVTLPDETDISTGTMVTIYDQYSTFGTNACRVISTHAEFENGSSTINLTNDGSKVIFIWNGGTQQWHKDEYSNTGVIGKINYISNDYNAFIGEFLFTDTTLNPITITLPLSGNIERESVITVFDQMGTFETNNVTVIPDFGTIDNDISYTIDSNGTRVDFIWDENESDWKIDVGGSKPITLLHAIGGPEHTSSTLAELNLKISDADLASSVHTHGNITSAGLIGTVATLPIITGAGGILQVGAFGTIAGTFCQGNDSRLSDARTSIAHAIAGSLHTSSTLAELNLKISDADLAPSIHAHGNITSAGYIGTIAALPIITGTSGILQAGAFGTIVGTFCQGNDYRLDADRTRKTTVSTLVASGGVDGDVWMRYTA